jgi:hypothetical protein
VPASRIKSRTHHPPPCNQDTMVHAEDQRRSAYNDNNNDITDHTQSLHIPLDRSRPDRSHSHNGRPAAAATYRTCYGFAKCPPSPAYPMLKLDLISAEAKVESRYDSSREKATALTRRSTPNHFAKGGTYQQDLPCISIITDSSPLLLPSESQLLTLFAGGLGPSFEPLSQDAETPAR